MMPLSIFNKLKKVKMKPSNITLTLVDDTIKITYGVVANVMVETNQVIFPTDL